MLRQGALALAALALAAPGVAQDAVRSPGEIVATAPSRDWVTIAPQDLLVMTLAPDAEGNARKVVIQLIGAPFSQGWVDNIRTLAKAKYWDGMAILRVQDNYVVQWGQPDPGMGIAEKPVPDGLKVMSKQDYTADFAQGMFGRIYDSGGPRDEEEYVRPPMRIVTSTSYTTPDPYADAWGFSAGFPIAMDLVNGRRKGAITTVPANAWPVHCYGMVGVGRGNPPDTGDGSQLYAVIGHAPRHLDRNLAVVGRVVDGIEHLSSLPRGKGPASYYADPAKRVPIVSVRLAAELPKGERPHFEYLATDSDSFAQYVDARAHRRDPFFVTSADGADICNIPVPIRAVAAE